MYCGSNFEDLMSMAKQNADDAKRRAKHSNLLPEINRPKKADPKQVKLKQGVAKFLAQREEEERRRKELERQKKEQLIQLRNQDRKATNRVRKMLSMTKSANKSCVADAKDSLNASVSAQGEFVPDEDDYGYTSNYADMMHKKMLEQYKSIPVKPTFPESRGVPMPKHQALERMKNGLEPKSDRHEEKGNGYSPNSDHDTHDPGPGPSSKKNGKYNSKPKAPPPPDYKELLQLAQEKQKEPLIAKLPLIEKKGPREEFEFGRPMTAKEKAAYLAEKELKERCRKKFEKSGSSSSSEQNSATKPSTSFKIPKGKTKEDPSAPPIPAKKSKPSEVPSAKEPQKPERKLDEIKELIKKPKFLSAFDGGKEKSKDSPKDKFREPRPGSSRDEEIRRDRDNGKRPMKHKDRDAYYSERHRDRDREMQYSHRGRAIVESDEEEYDSELDDFIDDSEVSFDISSEISKIFKYDRRRFAHADESDDECMESSVAEQLREEDRSLRIGIKEDLEDMRREEEEKRRKMLKLKKKVK